MSEAANHLAAGMLCPRCRLDLLMTDYIRIDTSYATLHWCAWSTLR